MTMTHCSRSFPRQHLFLGYARGGSGRGLDSAPVLFSRFKRCSNDREVHAATERTGPGQRMSNGQPRIPVHDNGSFVLRVVLETSPVKMCGDSTSLSFWGSGMTQPGGSERKSVPGVYSRLSTPNLRVTINNHATLFSGSGHTIHSPEIPSQSRPDK